jgi:hypothetical protein
LLARTVYTEVCSPDLTALQLPVLFIKTIGPLCKPLFGKFKIFRGRSLSKTIEIPTARIGLSDNY